MHLMNHGTGQVIDHRGFDAAIKRREDDHLGRWALAREICGIATTGPKDWSVRVGVYGHWGMGKTSVLEFVDKIAASEGNIVVWFNPWQHTTKTDLWRSFVLTVFAELRRQVGDLKAGSAARRKEWLGKAAKIVRALSGAANEKAGKAVDMGLDLVNKHFSFSKSDLTSLRALLGTKRIMVLVDDLDRTAPELVPEILFAFKEILDVPGFSFICAFDPAVVGEVLGRYHPGFGSGIEFLEKIIDYPRWLPPASTGGLIKLAVADAARYCPYVPEQSIADAVQVLPPNPRTIRQFVRLLALLNPQIDRHDANELRWPVIVAANVIKVRFPEHAPVLLGDHRFWEKISLIPLMTKQGEEREEISKAIETRVKAVLSNASNPMGEERQKDLKAGMEFLCSLLSWGTGVARETFEYQLRIAESPRTVTRKEFGEFAAVWDSDPSATNVEKWIDSHASKVEFPEVEVYHGLLDRLLERYPDVLRRADGAYLEEERLSLLREAGTLIKMIQCLVLELGNIDKPQKRLGFSQIEHLLDAFVTILRGSTSAIASYCDQNEGILNEMIRLWQGDVTPLIEVVLPYGNLGSRRFDDSNARELHRRLCTRVLPKLAEQIVAGLRQTNFVQRSRWAQDAGTQQIRAMILDHKSVIWNEGSAQLIQTLRDAHEDSTLQDNVYCLLDWFDGSLEERAGTEEAERILTVLRRKEVRDALWGAATANPLSPYAAIRLDRLVQRLQQLEATVDLPLWWSATIQSMPHPKQETQDTE